MDRMGFASTQPIRGQPHAAGVRAPAP
jgi:hypothetical protein